MLNNKNTSASLAQRRKSELEIQLLELQLAEQTRPPWKRKEVIGLQGSILAAVLGTLLAAITGFWSVAERVEDDVKRKLVDEVVDQLNAPEAELRRFAGHQLSQLDPRFNLRSLIKAYDKSVLAGRTGLLAKEVKTPYQRVGAVEAVGLGPEKWRSTPRAELVGFLLRALREDSSPLVRYKAALALASSAYSAESGLTDELASTWRSEQARHATPQHVRDAYGGTALLVPAGRYVIGRDDGERVEGPAREVTLEAFWIDARPVTNLQWEKWMPGVSPAIEGYAVSERRSVLLLGRQARPDLPVAGVSHEQAKAYCLKTGRRSLPTEIQWEVAARGDSGWHFPWGFGIQPALAALARERTIKQEAATEKFGFTFVQRLSEGEPRDKSTFGVERLVSSVRHWTASAWPDEPGEGAIDSKTCTTNCVVRGASGWEADVYNTVERFNATRRIPEAVRNGNEEVSSEGMGFRCVSSNRP